MRLVRYSYPSYRSLSPVFGGAARAPWPGLETEIDRLFENALGQFSGTASTTRFPVDLFEDAGSTFVRAELPGVNRDDINVEVIDGNLSIKATRKTPAADGNPEGHYSFNRTLALNDAVQADQISAAYENGVLTVTLPKREEVKPKKITVAVK